jgi:hypothetical protein
MLYFSETLKNLLIKVSFFFLKKLSCWFRFKMTQYQKRRKICGYSSVVERHLAKVHVARSNRVTRFRHNVATKNEFFSSFQKRKGGRAVECIGFENRRSCETTGGSNPPLSGKNFKVDTFFS